MFKDELFISFKSIYSIFLEKRGISDSSISMAPGKSSLVTDHGRDTREL